MIVGTENKLRHKFSSSKVCPVELLSRKVIRNIFKMKKRRDEIY